MTTITVAGVTYDLIRVQIQDLETYCQKEGLQAVGPLPPVGAAPRGCPDPWPPIVIYQPVGARCASPRPAGHWGTWPYPTKEEPCPPTN